MWSTWAPEAQGGRKCKGSHSLPLLKDDSRGRLTPSLSTFQDTPPASQCHQDCRWVRGWQGGGEGSAGEHLGPPDQPWGLGQEASHLHLRGHIHELEVNEGSQAALCWASDRFRSEQWVQQHEITTRSGHQVPSPSRSSPNVGLRSSPYLKEGDELQAPGLLNGSHYPPATPRTTVLRQVKSTWVESSPCL